MVLADGRAPNAMLDALEQKYGRRAATAARYWALKHGGELPRVIRTPYKRIDEAATGAGMTLGMVETWLEGRKSRGRPDDLPPDDPQPNPMPMPEAA